MRTRFAVPVIFLYVALVVLTACAQATTPAPSVAPEPTTLQGQSEHWKLTIDYLVKDQALEEVTSIQYLSTDEVIEATVTITHNAQPPFVYQVISPLLLAGGQAITLGERAKVATWRDTEKIAIQWKVGTNRFTEYITPTRKLNAATS